MKKKFYPLLFGALLLLYEPLCGVAQSTLTDVGPTCDLYVHHRLGHQTPLDVAVRLQDGRLLSFQRLHGDPVRISDLEPKTVLEVRWTDGEQRSGVLAADDGRITWECAESRRADVTSARGVCGNGITPYSNCDNENYNVRQDNLAKSTYVHLDNDYMTCIGYVDDQCAIGPSFETFCTHYPSHSAGGYQAGYIHYDKVIGRENYTAATGISMSDRQSEELNWVLCHATQLGYSKAQMNQAIWGIMNQISCSSLCHQARNAISTPSGQIGPNLEFYVPRNGDEVQPQLRNACYRPETESLLFPCGEQKSIDTYVKGLLTLDAADRYIDLPDPGSIDRIVAEVWVEPQACPGNNLPSAFGLRADGGSAVPEQIVALGTDIIQTSSSTTIEQVYRYTFIGSHARISVVGALSGGCAPSSMAVYVVRNSDGGASALNTGINREFDRSSYELTVLTGPSPVDRDLTVTVPIHEIGNNGRIARIEAWYDGGPVVMEQTTFATEGLEASIIELAVPDVPAAIDFLNVRITSPNSNGESFGVGSVSVSSERACCAAAAASNDGDLFCEELVCGPCDGRITALSLIYHGSDTANIEVIQQDGQTVFNGPVGPGEAFAFTGQASQGTLSSWVRIWINGVYHVEIHTSCSPPQPLIGMMYGDFEMIAGESRNNGPLCNLDGTPLYTTSVNLYGTSTSNDVVYQWLGPDGFTSGLQNPVAFLPGDYILQVTDTLTGCTSADTTTVGQAASGATCNATNSGQLSCTVSSVLLDAGTADTAVFYLWEGPNGYTANTPVAVATDVGTYTLTITPVSGCATSCQTVVSANAHAWEDTRLAEICDGESYTLPDGTTTTQPGIYIDTLHAGVGCDSIVTTILRILPIYEVYQDVALCEGETFTLPDGSVTSADVTHNFTTTSGYGCDSTITTTVHFLPDYDLVVADTICQGEVYILPDGSETDSSGTYLYALTAAAGCDSTVTTRLTVLPEYHQQVDVTLCAGETYTLPDGSVTSTDVTHNLTLISANGCDSTVTTVVQVAPQYAIDEAVVLCAGETYTLPDGSVTSTDVTHTESLSSFFGCDSTITYDIRFLPEYDLQISDSICSGTPYLLPDGSQTTEAGTYTFAFLTAAGCDSTVTARLAVFPDYEQHFDVTICEGQTYTLPDGSIATTDMTQSLSFTSAFGCDSIIHTTVRVVPQFDLQEEVVLCAGETYTLPDGSVVSSDITYNESLSSFYGCDSIITYDISFLPEYDLEVADTICSGETYLLPNGEQVNQAGTYTFAFLTAAGCDSTVTARLAVFPEYEQHFEVTICEGQTYTLPDGSIATTDMTQSLSFTSAFGCDSIIHTTVRVVPQFDLQEEVVLCAGETYTLPDGSVVSSDITYNESLSSFYGCDSIITYDISFLPEYDLEVADTICSGETYLLPNGEQVNQAGSYTFGFLTAAGCDSTVTARLAVFPEYEQHFEVTICEGQTYTLPDGSVASTDMTQSLSLTSAFGCDSIIHTTVRVVPQYNMQEEVVLCAGETHILPDGSVTSTDVTYTELIASANGCDSITTTTVRFLPEYSREISDTICSGEIYILPDGSETTVGGTFQYPWQTAAGCDSIITSRLTVLPAYEQSSDIALCQGETYTLPDGSVVSSDVSLTLSLTTASGCDSTIHMAVRFQQQYESVEEVVLCDGESYTLPDGSVTSSDVTHTESLNSFYGCDSNLTTVVRFLPAYYLEMTDTICSGEVYILPDGSETTESGTFQYPWYTAAGCDSTITARLTVLPIYEQQFDVILCEGETYTLPDGSVTSTDVTHSFSLNSIHGCDSVITTSVRFMPQYAVNVEVVLCAGETYTFPDGSVTSTDVTHTESLSSIYGCDSSTTFTVRFIPLQEERLEYSLCDGDTLELPNGQLVTQPATIVDSLESSFGCDSLVTHSITIVPTSSVYLEANHCSGEPVEIGNELYDSTGVYLIEMTNVHGCDSLVVLDLFIHESYHHFIDTFLCPGTSLTIAGQVFDSPGSYVVDLYSEAGCDSTYFIEIDEVDAPFVKAREDTTIRQGADVEAYLLDHSTRPMAFQWFRDDTLLVSEEARFTDAYFRKAHLTIIAIDTNQCVTRDDFRIALEESCPEDLIFVPNIISPNHDNHNDVFTILNPAQIQISEVAIFNRWGEIVHHEKDFERPWDGTFRGEPLDPAVYTYFIQGDCASGDKLLKKGNITLMK